MTKRFSAVICTVSSPSYFHLAKTLMQSVIKNAWEMDRYVFLVDSSEDLPRFSTDLFTTIPLEGLFGSLPLIRLFPYSNTEMAMSLKPMALLYLLNRNYEKVIFLDADTLITGPPDPILSKLDSHDGLITPHITEPLNDGFPPDDISIMISGAYNSGFVAVKASDEGRRFVEWWNARLSKWCLKELNAGLNRDQRPLDMVPSLFPGILTDRSRGLNVAHWNLTERELRREQDVYWVGDTRLTFFHFAGYDPSDPDLITPKEVRFRTIGVPPTVRELLDMYGSRITENGLHEFKRLPYRYDYFSDGSTRIPPIIRKMYRQYDFIQDRFGDDPFDLTRDPGFRTTYNRRIEGGYSPITLLAHELFKADVERNNPFRSPWGIDPEQFADRFVQVVAPAWRLPDVFVEPIRGVLDESTRSNDGACAGKPIEDASEPAADSLARGLGESGTGKESRRPRVERADRPAIVQRLIAKTVTRVLPAVRRLLRICGVHNASVQMFHEVHSVPHAVADPVAELPRTKDFARAAINVVGWPKADSAMGELARSTVRSAAAVNIPVSPVNLTIGPDQPMTESVPEHVKPDASVSHKVNVVHVNGNLLRLALFEFGGRFFAGRYNVGYWDCGMPYLPESWKTYVGSFHEIWTPSTFFMEALGRAVSIPVIRMLPNVRVLVPDGIDRRSLGLPKDAFVFLCSTDLFDSPERANPIGCFEAFTRAFGTPDSHVYLCMAIRNAEHLQGVRQTIDQYAKRSAHVILLKDELDGSRMNALLNCCDSFVSLHRSVGFGLDIAKAMYLGKPVIATGWSGNTDYMNVGNSLPVRFDIREIAGEVEESANGHFWAEPDLDHAAEMMKAVVEDPSLREPLGHRARHDMRTHFSPERSGAMLRRRLDQISGTLGWYGPGCSRSGTATET